MKDTISASELRLWAKDEVNPMTAEGYLMAAQTIDNLEKKLKRHVRFVSGIKPHLLNEGYSGFAENIDELLETA